MQIEDMGADRLDQYASVPISFVVDSILEVQLLDSGLGGIQLVEKRVDPAWVKDYDALESPLNWPAVFDVRTWFFALAVSGQEILGGAAVAWNTAGVHMLEGRPDLSVLWDIRVRPEARRQGIGRALFERAAAWSRARGCAQMKIETQNINVRACRFYAAAGATLGSIRRFAYRPPCAEEVELDWYLPL